MTTSFARRVRQLCTILGWAAFPFGVLAAGYRTEPIWDDLRFNAPVQTIFAPGETDRRFVVERDGRIIAVRGLDDPQANVFLDLTARVNRTDSDSGLLAAAFHPDFATNGHVFVWHSMPTPEGQICRLSRYTATDPAHGTAAVASELPLLSRPNVTNSHDGGDLFFGPDGYLYLSIGDSDAQTNPATAAQRQRIDRGFYGVVLRLDVDQRPENLAPHPHPSVHAGSYRVPADNPFVGTTTYHGETLDPARVRTEIFALGLRNPFRMTHDPATDRIWLGDVGLDAAEEIDLIEAGGNYGWPWREGPLPGPVAPPATGSESFHEPVWSYTHSGNRSLTGGVVYRGATLPELTGAYLGADLIAGRIFAVFDDGERPLGESHTVDLANDDFIVHFARDPGTDDVLLTDLIEGSVKRLVRAAPPIGLVNLSARAIAGTGENVLVPGFVIAEGAQRVLVRGVGPTLAEPPFELPGTLPQPRIALRRTDDLIAANHDWRTSGNVATLRWAAEVAGAFPLGAAQPDSALLLTLEPGAYTVVTDDESGQHGEALVEIYAIGDTAPDSGRLVNLALRAAIAANGPPLIAGFVVAGTTNRTLLVRAVGPGLARHGVDAPLADPVLTLFAGATAINANRDWRTLPDREAVTTAFAQTGAFALSPDDADCALLTELSPGAYTVQLTSATAQAGIVLLEVYLVP